MAYEIRILPRFQKDLDAAADHIAGELQNKTAAYALVDEFVRMAEQAAAFPLATPHYTVVDGQIYRAVKVRNYLAFYVVLEDAVEFRRFLYARSDLPTHLGE